MCRVKEHPGAVLVGWRDVCRQQPPEENVFIVKLLVYGTALLKGGR
jgi:hypothetical protein